MGLVLFLVIFEIGVFLLYLPHAKWYWPIVPAFLYYLMLLTDDSEKTGAKSWNWLRNLNFWHRKMTAVHYSFGNKEELDKYAGSKILFVIIDGNTTNMAMISGVGLHGGVFRKFDICYILPWILFKIPLLREGLMWTGAISSGQGDITTAILKGLNCGKSICYSINGMKNSKQTDDELEIPEDLFNFAQEHGIYLVPWRVHDENKRYWSWRHPIQDFFSDLCGFPFPLVFMPRILGEDPPPKVDNTVGIPMDPRKYKGDKKGFEKLFFIQLTGVV